MRLSTISENAECWKKGAGEPEAFSHTLKVEGIVEEVVVEDWLLPGVGGLEPELALADGQVKGGANSNTDRVLVIEAPGRPPGGVVPHVNDHVIDERRAGGGVAEGDRA